MQNEKPEIHNKAEARALLMARLHQLRVRSEDMYANYAETIEEYDKKQKRLPPYYTTFAALWSVLSEVYPVLIILCERVLEDE